MTDGSVSARSSTDSGMSARALADDVVADRAATLAALATLGEDDRWEDGPCRRRRR